MSRRNNKTFAIAIAFILAASIGASMILVPATTAHTPKWNIDTFAYVVALPNPIGVGQATTIYMFLGNLPYPSAALNNNYRYHGYELTITAPNGENTTKSWDEISDPTNSQYYSFTPDTVGTYTLSFRYKGQDVNDYPHDPSTSANSYTNDTFLPSSYVNTLTVQQDPVSNLPQTPLPTEYWTRPIYGENTDWWSISSNWLGSGIVGYGSMPGPNEQMFSGESVGPKTSHIVWTKPLQSGGVAGGNNFEVQGNSFFEGSAYNQRFVNPIILDGKLYYINPVSFTGASSGSTDCVDLRTGQLIWSRTDIPALSFGLIWDHEDPNQHGVYPPLLFTSNFARAFDAYTGTPLFNVTGVPGGSSVRGPNGEVLKYVFINTGTSTNPNYVLGQWNSTKLWNYVANPYNPTASLLSPSIINQSGVMITTIPIPVTGTTGTPPSGPTVQVPYGSTLIVNASVADLASPQNRYDYLYPVNWRNTMASAPSILTVFPGEMLLMRNGSYPALNAYNPYTYFAVNLNASKGDIGSIRWMKNIDPPADKNITTVTYAGASLEANAFAESYRQTSQFVGYSLSTGAKIWGPSEAQGPMDYYGSQGPGTLADQVAYGRIYSSAYSGILYAYDMKTGEVVFTYGNGGPGNSTNSGFEVPGPYPTFVNAIGDGVVYLITSEHTVQGPIYKGALMRAVNATDGTELWTLSNDNNEFAASSFGIADGFLTTFNAYDNQIYSVGRGPSATTVQAGPKVSTFGQNIVIEGTVTDTSAGTKQNEQAARFPHGVPVAADAVMGDWMGYIYQQKPLPTNFQGVEVSIDVVDANGNYRNVGSATTDASGAYHLVWQPDIPGTYTVIASFKGSNGYWPSYQETAFDVMEAQPTATQVPASTNQSMADPYFIPMSIAIIIAIVIIGALLAVMIRKRP
jgi:outer membrane protein assembly factor BamB